MNGRFQVLSDNLEHLGSVNLYSILNSESANMTIFKSLRALLTSPVSTQKHHIFISLHAYLALSVVLQNTHLIFKRTHSILVVRRVHQGWCIDWRAFCCNFLLNFLIARKATLCFERTTWASYLVTAWPEGDSSSVFTTDDTICSGGTGSVHIGLI